MLVSDYAGRFQSLAEGFESERCANFSNGILLLDDYLLRRVNSAVGEICQGIAERKLIAEGLAIVDGKERGIERLPSAAITETTTLREDREDSFLCTGPTIADGRCWKSVRVSWAGLMKCFPPAKPTIRAEADCKRWLQRLMKRSPNRRLQEKRDLLLEARTKFMGLSERAFNRAWICAATAAGAGAWIKGGAPSRPRKSPH
jgi:hypothetical protein